MTRVLALAGQSKIGCITQRRFAKVGTKTHPQRGAALDRNGLSVSTETACRFEPKSPVGNSEICRLIHRLQSQDGRAVARLRSWPQYTAMRSRLKQPAGGMSFLSRNSAPGRAMLRRARR